MTGESWSVVGLWLAVVVSGIYHGVSPGMGWPLAVSAGLMDRRDSALLAALWPLALGHFLAMAVVILPFAVLAVLTQWRTQIQTTAALLVVAFGVFKLLNRRHPRALARIKPTRLALWSFAVAIAHGAGLMLVPIYLGLCAVSDPGHAAAGMLMGSNLTMAVIVAAVHAAAMIISGGMLAWLVYRYLGLRFVSRSWFNLEAVWALSLIAVGIIGGVAAQMHAEFG